MRDLANISWIQLIFLGTVSLNVSTFQKFVNLVELNLNFINQAKDPQLISQLTKLTSLNISKLRVPIVITTLTNLQKLNMKYTEEPFLRCIFTQLSVLTHLKYLNFSDSQIRSNDFKYLTILTNLEHLSLYFGGENIVSNSMRSLLHLSKLTYLNCYYCPCLQDEDVVMFTRLSNLRYLELGHCRLTDNTIRALCLGRMSHLTHLGMPLLITDNSILYLTALHLLSINMWSTAKITSTGFRNLSLLTSLTSISIVSTSNLTQESVSSWSTLTRLQKVNIPHLPQESKV